MITNCGTLPPVQESFAATMADLRSRNGLSQNEAADLAGISRTLWRQMEDPERPFRPRRSNIVKVARLLAWELDEALPLAGHEEPPTELERAEMRRGPRDELNRILRKLNDEQIRRLTAFIRAMQNPNVLMPPEDDPEEDRSHPVRVHTVDRGIGEPSPRDVNVQYITEEDMAALDEDDKPAARTRDDPPG